MTSPPTNELTLPNQPYPRVLLTSSICTAQGQQSSTKVQSSVPEKMPQSKEPAKRSQRTALSAGENTADDCLLLKAQDNNSQEFPSNIEPAHLESDDYPLGQQPFTAAIKRSSDVNFEDSKKGKLDPLTEDSDDF